MGLGFLKKNIITFSISNQRLYCLINLHESCTSRFGQGLVNTTLGTGWDNPQPQKKWDGSILHVLPILLHSNLIFLSKYVPLNIFGCWTCWTLDLMHYNFSWSFLPCHWVKQRNKTLLAEHQVLPFKQVNWKARAASLHDLHGHYWKQGCWKIRALSTHGGKGRACSTWKENWVILHHRRQLKWVTTCTQCRCSCAYCTSVVFTT